MKNEMKDESNTSGPAEQATKQLEQTNQELRTAKDRLQAANDAADTKDEEFSALDSQLQAKVAEIRELSAAVREKSENVRAQTKQLQVVAAAISQMESKADFTEAMGGLQQQTGAAAAAQTALEIRAAPLKALNSDLNSVLEASRRVAAEILEERTAAREELQRIRDLERKVQQLAAIASAGEGG